MKIKKDVLDKITNDLCFATNGTKKISLSADVLKKHIIALGASGSGKTVICKTIIEEAAINNIPSILVDPQGDLSSLIEIDDNTNDEIKKKWENVRITIFTPTSSKGIPLCINPLQLPKTNLENEEIICILDEIANAICSLIGYDLEKDEGKSAQALFFLTLQYMYEQKIELSHFNDFANFLKNIPAELKEKTTDFIKTEQEIEKIIKKIKFLTIGEKELLFSFGVPIDINILLGKNNSDNLNNKINDKTKTQISIIYLNTLDSEEDKQFFVSMLTTKLYQWMLENPSKDVQMIYYIDEISTYLPAGSLKPSSKPILTLLYKQARKYGVSCMMSTQNPGDIDYKAFAQVSTWIIGRITTNQDKDKIKNALSSVMKNENQEKLLDELPKLQAGNFLLFSPDITKNLLQIKGRWLYTKHLTFTEKEIKEHTTNTLRKEYDSYFVKKIASDKNITSNEIKSLTNETNYDEQDEDKIALEKPKEQKIIYNSLKLNFSKDQAKELVQKECKKNILTFKPKETINELQLVKEPLLKISLRKIRRSLFSKKIESYTLLFNPKTFAIIDIKNNETYKGISELILLHKKELVVLKKIVSSFDIEKNNLQVKLGFEKDTFTKILHELKQKKLISTSEKNEKTIISQMTDILLPKDIKFANQENLVFDDKEINLKETIKPIKIEQLSNFLNIWYDDVVIIDYAMICCPVYEIELLGKNGKTRTLFINGYTSKTSF